MLCVEVVHSTPWAVFMEDNGEKESCLLIMSFSAVARPCVALSDQSRQEHGRELLFFIVAPYTWLCCVLGLSENDPVSMAPDGCGLGELGVSIYIECFIWSLGVWLPLARPPTWVCLMDSATVCLSSSKIYFPSFRVHGL